ncbi:MAG: hypothetical protein IPG48_02260 [Saprospiraceae bacterium]|nr:hypothetical protein [Saprospiraceae bacterium]MBK6664992.1 hypothetical protein [Saprospiraceae bacterium]MBK7699468.1 hypothetical protein [Saprospiraceae bacterium]MBK8826648.1 hypothetical protein [Saprospiraceae bacterium]MBK8885825.1 hypothetical protein [Saprospiraceae bacterium]
MALANILFAVEVCVAKLIVAFFDVLAMTLASNTLASFAFKTGMDFIVVAILFGLLHTINYIFNHKVINNLTFILAKQS